MPLYEYLCEACGKRFELIQKFHRSRARRLPKCGKGPVERQQSSPAIQFKGSGLYITDYARKGATPSGTRAASRRRPESASIGRAAATPRRPSPRRPSHGNRLQEPSQEAESRRPSPRRPRRHRTSHGSSTSEKS
jgi:putative FmdB family regulatory protein